MSDPEDSEQNFLQRWSRRKRTAETRAPDATEPPLRKGTDVDANVPPRGAAQSKADLPAFDPATLPPIESITATSDIRAFLAPGVPEQLTRAALRRAWATDPAVRDFIGLAENQWDFTNADSVPGFGTLELTPELRRIVAGLVGDAPERTTPTRHVNAEQDNQDAEIPTELPSPAMAQSAGGSGATAERSLARNDLIRSEDAPTESVKVILQDSNNDVAPQRGSRVGGTPRPAHRKHGGAVPK
jgi:Protein of unknown function (DUF3306)